MQDNETQTACQKPHSQCWHKHNYKIFPNPYLFPEIIVPHTGNKDIPKVCADKFSILILKEILYYFFIEKKYVCNTLSQLQMSAWDAQYFSDRFLHFVMA